MVFSPNIEHFFVTALQQRCSVVTNPLNGATVIIDGGGEPERIIDWIEHQSGSGPDFEINAFNGEKRVVALLNTHAHFDHSGHIPDLKEKYQVPHPGMTWEDTLGNLKVLDQWRQKINYKLNED